MKIPSHKNSGFSLLEILVAATVALILLSSFLSYAPSLILQRAMRTEDEALARVVTAFELSQESTDLETVNLTAITGELASGGSATAFSTSLAAPTTTAANSWFAKIGKVEGITPAIGNPPSRTSQPELARIAFNARDRPRYVFAAPAETTQQRFIVCSILGEDALTLPAYSATTAFFDSLWNTDFNSATTTLPAYWVTALSVGERAAWVLGQGGGGNLSRLRLARITVPKFTVTVNNNHATDSCWVYWNGGGGRLQSTANSGTSTTAPILAGRQLIVRIGTTEASAVERYRINIRKNVAVTVE